MDNGQHLRTAISRIHGLPVLVADGDPFFVMGAQCDIWRSTRQDDETIAFFDAYRDMGANTVGIGIPWSRIEIAPDRYEFAFMDWFIRQAELRGLKLFLHLFNSNICGKVWESTRSGGRYPQYAPDYLLDAPDTYQRMDLRAGLAYVAGGPPLCPNDPATLAREAAYLREVALHLRDRDVGRTVLALQLNNELYYQQWAGERPRDEKRIRCHCRHCDARYDPARHADEEEFMFRSFAAYTRVLSDTIRDMYDLPLYLNSPWWDPYIIPLFLQDCPRLDFVGIDGVFSPEEPNMLSKCQLDRNIAFAAECPTENDRTRMNLGILPYYVLLRRQGIGLLLWEAPKPKTVVHDPAARQRFREALIPLRKAMVPILATRGTDALAGWYVRTDMAEPVREKDVFGHDTGPGSPAPARSPELYVREGARERILPSGPFSVRPAGLDIRIESGDAGILLADGPSCLVLVSAGATLVLETDGDVSAESGEYRKDRWIPSGPVPVRTSGRLHSIVQEEPGVLRIQLQPAGQSPVSSPTDTP